MVYTLSMVTFTIPGKVTSSNMVKTPMAFGRAVKTSSARLDCERIRTYALACALTNDWEQPQVAGVTIVAWNSRLDVDNLPKCVLDGIKGVLILNDSPKRLRRLLVEHRRDKEGERYVVTVDVLV